MIKSSGATVKVDYDEYKSKKSADLHLIGFETHIITDQEIGLFGFHNWVIKEAIQKYNGGYPDDVFLRSPTPWNDLYTTYHWEQVQTTLVPVSAKVIKLDKKLALLAKRTFYNDTNERQRCTESITQKVKHSISSSWSHSHQLSVGLEINFEVDFLFASIGSSFNISYSGKWGEGKIESKSYTFGSTSGIKIDLRPKQTIIATLTATRGTIALEIVYEASVDGRVAVNYSNRHQGHHFYGIPISELELERKKQITQRIEVGFFSESKLTLTDKDTNTSVTIPQSDLVKLVGVKNTDDDRLIVLKE